MGQSFSLRHPLIDPHGNLMMRFPPGLGMRGMHSDLKRLLKVSRIG